VLDVQPARVNGTNATILSHVLWQSAFNGDPAIVGRVIALDGRPFTIVGVMPAGFDSLTGGAPPGCCSAATRRTIRRRA
jgi:putative ABC transport system permease protein